MEFLNSLKGMLGMTGGKRRRSRKAHRGGQPMGDYSLEQGANFAKMNEKFHGGRRRRASRKAHRGGAADLATAFEAIPADIHDKAGTAVLDQAIADLSKFTPAAAQTGGRRRKTRRGGALMGSPIDAPSMLLRPEDEAAAFLNPQWVQENLVNPNFVAPPSAYAATGGKRRRASKKTRKTKKSRKASRKAHRKSRKSCRKNMAGGKRRKTSKKASRKH